MMQVPSRVSGKLQRPGIFIIVLLLTAAAFPPSAPGADDAKAKEKARADIMKTTNETLSRLYKAQPQAKTAVEKAAGYAVFSNFGMKILVTGGVPARVSP